MKAAFTAIRENGTAVCGLCPHRCGVRPGTWGRCKTRFNEDGTLRAVGYGRLVASALDPVEKKPLFHFRPGSSTFSIASSGCNLRCPFCQNHRISQTENRWEFEGERRISPVEIVETARAHGAASISFTYSEPILMFELARDTADHAARAGLDLVFVTNGQATPEAAEALGRILRAANVDIKCFSESNYRKVLGGELRSTLDTISAWAAAGVWVEVTTLLIPGFNDTDEEVRQIARFISAVNPDIPWHISRYHPNYKWDSPGPSPKERIRAAREIGLAEGLRFVYTGNMPGDGGENTRCPSCAAAVIERHGFGTVRTSLNKGCCASCGEPIAGLELP